MQKATNIYWTGDWVELQSQYGHSDEEKNLLPLLGIEPHSSVVQPIVYLLHPMSYFGTNNIC
jgi:hypothetical protein